MFERWTERARHAVVLAQEEARGLKHHHIGTEHVLLGLLRKEEGLAARALESLDITAGRVRAQVVRIIGVGEEDPDGQIPVTPRAKKVLELALREALSLGHNYIGTEHILLGLVRENEGVAARILLDFDADSEKIRNEVMRLLMGPGHRRQSAPDPGSTIHLPRGVRLGSAYLHAHTWEAYNHVDWEETVLYDQRTGEPQPRKRNADWTLTVFPPVNVPEDGEFGVRRELVR